MRIEQIASSDLGRVGRRASTSSSDGDVPESRALVPIEAPTPGERVMATTRHPAAPFLAQLIATQMRAPQTRARRRAEAGEVIGHYSTMKTLPLGSRLRAFKRA
jgi:hypothetical protein